MKYCIRTSCTKKCKSEIISIRYAMGAETLYEIIKKCSLSCCKICILSLILISVNVEREDMH